MFATKATRLIPLGKVVKMSMNARTPTIAGKDNVGIHQEVFNVSVPLGLNTVRKPGLVRTLMNALLQVTNQ